MNHRKIDKKKTILFLNYSLVVISLILALSCNTEEETDNSIVLPNTVTDIDGNVYTTVVIGTQTWMVENLKVTKYRNGDTITNAKVDGHWNQILAGAYCNNDNDPANAVIYGRLYNWYAVYDWRNIAPEGWHVPTVAEWDTLRNFLIINEFNGGALKEAGTEHWLSPNEGGTNSTGFTALPGGRRYLTGQFFSPGMYGYWWSSSKAGSPTPSAYFRTLQYGDTILYQGHDDSRTGYSVRCIKD